MSSVSELPLHPLLLNGECREQMGDGKQQSVQVVQDWRLWVAGRQVGEMWETKGKWDAHILIMKTHRGKHQTHGALCLLRWWDLLGVNTTLSLLKDHWVSSNLASTSLNPLWNIFLAKHPPDLHKTFLVERKGWYSIKSKNTALLHQCQFVEVNQLKHILPDSNGI